MWKAFDRIVRKRKTPPPSLCDHKRISEGVCEECFEILWMVQVTSGHYDRCSHRVKNDKSKAKTNRFHNAHCIPFCVCTDYEKFSKAYNEIEKKRKNSLINGFVAYHLFKRKGVDVEEYIIKSEKSSEEHNHLCQKVFHMLEWGHLH